MCIRDSYNTVGNSFDKLLSDSRALLLELVLPDGEVVVKEYDREAEDTDGVFEETDLVNIDPDDVDKRTATTLLKDMLGNIVEVNIDGDFVTIEDSADADLINDEDLKADFHGADKEATYNFNSETDIFSLDKNVTPGNAVNVKSFAVDETCLLYTSRCV